MQIRTFTTTRIMMPATMPKAMYLLFSSTLVAVGWLYSVVLWPDMHPIFGEQPDSECASVLGAIHSNNRKETIVIRLSALRAGGIPTRVPEAGIAHARLFLAYCASGAH